MISVYALNITSRHKYVFKYIFETLLKIDYELISDLSAAKGILLLNYSHQEVEDALTIVPFGLLNQEKLTRQDIQVIKWEETKCFFVTGGDLPFDIFSASFYLLSRFEEYLPHINDKHGRFPAEQSLNYKNGFLESPVVEIWAKKLKRLFLNYNNNLVFGRKESKITATYDIDNAWAYKNKRLGITLGGLYKAYRKFGYKEVKNRLKICLNKGEDPYDTYEYIKSSVQANDIQQMFFFLLGDRAEFDKNVSYKNKKLKELILALNQNAVIGIHPSYASNSSNGKTAMEMRRLEKILGDGVFHSRQHFLKLSLPETYRKLINCGIKNDYTMGFANKVGFRAGTSTPFYFYDIKREEETKLLIHPFAYMDGTLNEYMEFSPKKAKSKISELISNVKNVNGEFIFLWHNETLNDKGKWEGWRDVYEYTLKEYYEN